MSSAPDPIQAWQALLQASSTAAPGVSQFLAWQKENWPLEPHRLDPSAWSAGPQELMALHEDWVKRHAELLQCVLDERVVPPGRLLAEPEAGNQQVEGPVVPDANPMSAYMREAVRINAECLKRVVEVAPVVAAQAQDQMRVVTEQVADALASPNVLAADSELAVSNYPEIRDKLRSGDIIVACKGNLKSFNGFLSLLIRVFTASSYSHVGIVVKLGNRCFVVEATPPVVRLYPLSKLDSFYVIKMEQEWSREDENRLFELVGLPYSDWNSVASYFTGRPLANGKLQCAQLVSSFYDWPNLLRPEQIVRYTQEKLGKQMVFVR